MDMPTRFRVAICGGGIGGLTFALALAQYSDATIDVYEATARFEEIGAGLVVWGRGLAVLRKLGLEERIRAKTTAPPVSSQGTKYELRKADEPSGGELIGYLPVPETLGLHRSQFLDLLVEMVAETGRVNTHFGKRCVSFIQREDIGNGDPSDQGSVVLHFADATSATCDVLVGCDGIKSAVRGELLRVMVPEATRYSGTTFSGTVAYRALVQPTILREIFHEHSAITGPKIYLGKDKHIATYPVGGGKFVNVVAYTSDPAKREGWESGPWVAEATHEELLDQYKHFEPEVQAILKCIDKSSRWAMYDVEPLQFWSKGRVTLLGDAAHATTPFLGAGGGQVFEDAYVLSRLLGSPAVTLDSPSHVLRAYEQVRRPRANRVILCSRESRRAFEFLEEYEHSSNEEVLQASNRLTDWLLEDTVDLDDDVREAEKLFQVFRRQNP